MIYTDEWIDGRERITVLKDRVIQSEDNQLIMWATCFKQNDPGEKVLRNIPPVQVVVTTVEEINRHSRIDLFLKAYEQDGYLGGRRKEIKITSSNNHGDLIICDTYRECVETYNNIIRRELERAKEVLVSRTAYINSRIKLLESSFVPGFVVEEVK